MSCHCSCVAFSFFVPALRAPCPSRRTPLSNQQLARAPSSASSLLFSCPILPCSFFPPFCSLCTTGPPSSYVLGRRHPCTFPSLLPDSPTATSVCTYQSPELLPQRLACARLRPWLRSVLPVSPPLGSRGCLAHARCVGASMHSPSPRYPVFPLPTTHLWSSRMPPGTPALPCSFPHSVCVCCMGTRSGHTLDR